MSILRNRSTSSSPSPSSSLTPPLVTTTVFTFSARFGCLFFRLLFVILENKVFVKCVRFGEQMKHFRIRNFPIFALYTFTRSYTRTRDTITTSDCSDTVTSLLCVPIRIKLYPRVSAPVPPRATPIDSQQPQQKERQRGKEAIRLSCLPRRHRSPARGEST